MNFNIVRQVLFKLCSRMQHAFAWNFHWIYYIIIISFLTKNMTVTVFDIAWQIWHDFKVCWVKACTINTSWVWRYVARTSNSSLCFLYHSHTFAHCISIFSTGESLKKNLILYSFYGGCVILPYLTRGF